MFVAAPYSQKRTLERQKLKAFVEQVSFKLGIESEFEMYSYGDT